MDLLHMWEYTGLISSAITLAGLAFFGALTIGGLVWRNGRPYLPGLLLIDLGLVSSLVPNLFLFDLSFHPATAGGLWRITTALMIVAGFVLLVRAWQRTRIAVR